jgi:hypothetical protein
VLDWAARLLLDRLHGSLDRRESNGLEVWNPVAVPASRLAGARSVLVRLGVMDHFHPHEISRHESALALNGIMILGFGRFGARP